MNDKSDLEKMLSLEKTVVEIIKKPSITEADLKILKKYSRIQKKYIDKLTPLKLKIAVKKTEVEILNRYFTNLPEIRIFNENSDESDESDKYWQDFFNKIIKIDFIEKYLGRYESEVLTNENVIFYKTFHNFYWSLQKLESKGILKKIKTFIIDNNLNDWTNEIYFLAFFYEIKLNDAKVEAKFDFDNVPFNYHQQRNKLIKVINELNVRHPDNDDEGQKAPFINSIVIKTSQPIGSITINNKILCHDIANTLREYLEITDKYSNGAKPLKEPKRKNTKPEKTYLRRFTIDTYPLFLFLKNECNLQLTTDREYFYLISQFLECLGFNLSENINQLVEDYIKDCYKHFKTKGLKQ